MALLQAHRAPLRAIVPRLRAAAPTTGGSAVGNESFCLTVDAAGHCCLWAGDRWACVAQSSHAALAGAPPGMRHVVLPGEESVCFVVDGAAGGFAAGGSAHMHNDMHAVVLHWRSMQVRERRPVRLLAQLADTPAAAAADTGQARPGAVLCAIAAGHSIIGVTRDGWLFDVPPAAPAGAALASSRATAMTLSACSSQEDLSAPSPLSPRGRDVPAPPAVLRRRSSSFRDAAVPPGGDHAPPALAVMPLAGGPLIAADLSCCGSGKAPSEAAGEIELLLLLVQRNGWSLLSLRLPAGQPAAGGAPIGAPVAVHVEHRLLASWQQACAAGSVGGADVIAPAGSPPVGALCTPAAHAADDLKNGADGVALASARKRVRFGGDNKAVASCSGAVSASASPAAGALSAAHCNSLGASNRAPLCHAFIIPAALDRYSIAAFNGTGSVLAFDDVVTATGRSSTALQPSWCAPANGPGARPFDICHDGSGRFIISFSDWPGIRLVSFDLMARQHTSCAAAAAAASRATPTSQHIGCDAAPGTVYGNLCGGWQPLVPSSPPMAPALASDAVTNRSGRKRAPDSDLSADGSPADASSRQAVVPQAGAPAMRLLHSQQPCLPLVMSAQPGGDVWLQSLPACCLPRHASEELPSTSCSSATAIGRRTSATGAALRLPYAPLPAKRHCVGHTAGVTASLEVVCKYPQPKAAPQGGVPAAGSTAGGPGPLPSVPPANGAANGSSAGACTAGGMLECMRPICIAECCLLLVCFACHCDMQLRHSYNATIQASDELLPSICIALHDVPAFLFSAFSSAVPPKPPVAPPHARSARLLVTGAADGSVRAWLLDAPSLGRPHAVAHPHTGAAAGLRVFT